MRLVIDHITQTLHYSKHFLAVGCIFCTRVTLYKIGVTGITSSGHSEKVYRQVPLYHSQAGSNAFNCKVMHNIA